MKEKTYQGAIGNLTHSNRTLRYVAIGSTAIALLLTAKVFMMHERIVVMPPNITGPAILTYDSANSTYLADFGLFLISSISSVTPQRVDLVRRTVGPYFAPKIMTALSESLNAVKFSDYGGYTPFNLFYPASKAIYEPATGRYFFYGKLVSTAYRNMRYKQYGSMDVTYEMKIIMQSGRPYVTQFSSYQGVPRTEAWREKNPSLYKKYEDEISTSRMIQAIPPALPEDVQAPDSFMIDGYSLSGSAKPAEEKKANNDDQDQAPIRPEKDKQIQESGSNQQPRPSATKKLLVPAPDNNNPGEIPDANTPVQGVSTDDLL